MSVVALLLGMAAVSGVVYAVWGGVAERQEVRATLRALDGYELEQFDDAREHELVGSAGERLLVPVLQRFARLARRATPTGYVDGVRLKLQHLGDGSVAALDRFLARRLLSALAGVVAFLAIAVVGVLPLSPLNRLVVGGLLAFALVVLPDARLDRAVAARQRSISRSLADVLDLLTISVEAGLGFEQALDRVVGAMPGPLSDEFVRMLGEVRAGAGRADALRALEERVGVPELRGFVMAVIQADTFGVSIGRVMRSQADEMRIRRRQDAQERAQKAPVKMLVPMVFCIFPALFAVVLGPAVLMIRAGL